MNEYEFLKRIRELEVQGAAGENWRWHNWIIRLAEWFWWGLRRFLGRVWG